MGMQVTVDGNSLDNGSWRYIVEDTGDDISLDNTRVLATDFVIEADDAGTLADRWRSTREDFIKANPRCTFNLDDSQAKLLADVSPNDGTHNSVKSTVGMVAGKGQTAYSLYCRLYVEAEQKLFNAGGAAGQPVTTYTGMVGKLSRTRTLDSGRTQSRDLLLTFEETFNVSAGGSVTITSVEDASGKARFVISEVPPTFAAGMRLQVNSSTTANGAGYAGRHLITAIDVANKKITTEAAYDGTETGAGTIGTLTSGKANYEASRTDILTDLLGTANDGSRDGTTGLYLALEKFQDEDENSYRYEVLLQARYAETEFTGLNDAQRDLDIEILETEPDEWDAGGGTKPVYLTVQGSIVCDRDELADGNLVLHQVFRDSLVTQLKTLALTQSNYGSNARLRHIEFGSRRVNSRITFKLVYQARNLNTLLYRSETMAQTEDDRVSWKAGPYHYDQRPDGLPPKVITRTITYVGWTKKELSVPTPPGDSGATYSPGPIAEGPKREFDSPDGKLYARTVSQVFYRRKYKGGAQGVKVVA